MLVGLTVGEDYGLAAKRSDLRAANVEDVAVARQIGQ